MAKIISRRPERQQPNKAYRSLSLKDFWERHNKILIVRKFGGLGDILMHRMIFEDFKLLMPSADIHFACPSKYHQSLIDHPFINKLLGIDTADKTTECYDLSEYTISYDTSVACGKYESKIAPRADLHRSDIWAQYCGVNLTKHNMHIQLTDEELAWGENKLAEFGNGPYVLVNPISAMKIKDLSDPCITKLFDLLESNGFNPIGIHADPIEVLLKRSSLYHLKIRQWMSVIQASNYMISVDSAAFHCAGGMNKPVLGIFTFANGDVYSQHYPKAQSIQGPCPFGIKGCYNWHLCPDKSKSTLPCNYGTTPQMIFEAFERLVKTYPWS